MVCCFLGEGLVTRRSTALRGQFGLYYPIIFKTSIRGNLLSGHLLKSSSLVSMLTLVSRLLGFARDVVIARYFGVGAVTDAFLVAFRIPNFLRRLFADGSFSLAFMPLLMSNPGADSALNRRQIEGLLGALLVVLAQLSLIGCLLAPLLVALFAPGLLLTAQDSDLCVSMLRITFPYLFFIVLTAFAGGILHTRAYFALPAFTPVVLNICMISAAVWLAPLMEPPIMAMAWAVLIAGVLQFALQIPALALSGYVPRPRFAVFGYKKAWTALRGVMPSLLGVSVPQLNILVDTFLASFLTAGSISWLYYADRYIELPVAMVGVALGTTLLPHLAAVHRRDDNLQFSAVLDWGLRWVILISLPAACGVGFLAAPLMTCVFGTDSDKSADVTMAARSLLAYAPALPGLVAMRLLSTAFAARNDSATLLNSGILAISLNAGLGVVLTFLCAPQGWKHAALTLATAISTLLQSGVLLIALMRKDYYQPLCGWRAFASKIAFAAVVMLLNLAYLDALTVNLGEYLRLFILVVGGAGCYFVMLWLLGLRLRYLCLPKFAHS